jgi:tetrathionate reductase subunit B
MKKRFGFVIDVSRCIDCRACMVACSVENYVPINHSRIWVQDQGVDGVFPELQRLFVPYNCMHCENPPCTEVCVSGATYKDKDTGLVLVDQEACIGCGFCVEACPYDARYLDEKRGVVDKCTGCIQRVETGQQPACVTTCIGGSRLFGDLNDPESDVSYAIKNARLVQRLDYESGGIDTDPNVFYVNAPEGISSLKTSDPFDQMGKEVPRSPRYTLSEVGWKKILVPAVLTGIGAAFLVQATYFTKQLIEGEKEVDE